MRLNKKTIAFPTLHVALFLVCLQVSCLLANGQSTDLYDLLGVSKDASLKEIRKAFKALAVLQHPDKNPDDSNATSNFIKLTRAYDILKDTELRKQYDLYGDEGINPSTSQNFKSYSYYKNEFGIYDDDPLIVTLSKADYDVNVLDENQAWWINFYSPACHHCHVLAPTWRKLSQELEGVVRIAAVNCEDDYVLCHQLSIGGYPSLLYYEKEAHLYDGEKYTGPKHFEEMQDFILSKLQVNVEQIDAENWEKLNDKNWLLFLCGPFGGERCPEPQIQIKLAAVFEGLMSVGIVSDEELCDKLSPTHATQPVVLYQVNGGKITVDVIEGSDKKEYVDSILNFLPTPAHLDEKQFAEIRNELRDKDNQIEEETKPWLICFYLGTATELNLQLKRLPTIIPNIKIGLIHCGKSAGLCQALHVSRYPTWGLLKPGGAFELHHGRDVLHEVADFARDGAKATNLHALSPADYKSLHEDQTPWFIDWYAPWCPPCRRLMPQIRKASQHFQPSQIKFGTIDCTMHQSLCASENIRSYPTTMIYQKGDKHLYHGALNENEIVEYIQEMLNPSVVHLTQENFVQLMRKPVGEIWLVDYYAPWCGPCQRLMPVWRALAREMKEFVNITIASVDCVKEADLCSAQNINSYPMIRLYPRDSYGLNSVAMYTGHRDLMNLKSWIFAFLPTKVVTLTSDFVKKRVLKKSLSTPWLVDFYAPWCGHCVDFEPKFRTIAEELDGIARAGKLDCQAERNFCIDMRVTSYPTLRLYFSKDKYYPIDTISPEFVVQETKRIIEANGRSNHDEL